jgi:flagellar hook-associated protein 3 FlgL
MRVPTLDSSRSVFAGIEARQSAQNRLQLQLSTGQRINSPGDDPVGAAQAELARSRLAHLAHDKRAQQLSASVLSAADGALGQGVGVLQDVREKLVAAGNGSYNAEDRKSLALALRSARDELLAVANTRDGAGGFVFAGQGTADEPLAAGSAPAYGAAAGEQRVGDGGRYATTVDGRASFMSLPQGNGVFVTASDAANTGTGWIDPGSVSNPAQLTGHDYRISIGGAAGSLTYSITDTTAGATLVNAAPYVDGASITLDGQSVKIAGTPAAGDSFQIAPAGQQSVFTTLDQAIALLESPAGATYPEQMARVQANVDRALDGMVLARSRVGAEANAVDSAAASGEQETLTATSHLSDLRDLDFARAISELQGNQTALEAALKTYAGVAKTSLFQLLG